MNQLQTFNFSNQSVRIVIVDDNPWWVLADVCGVLEIGNPSMVDFDRDEVRTLRITEGGPERRIINESGLYSMIMRSRKPEARAFRKWVTSEVLPQIRRTGSYGIQQLSRLQILEMALESEKKLIAANQQLLELQPAKKAYDEFLHSEGDRCLTDFAKCIGLSGVVLCYWLKENGYLWKLDTQKAVQKYLDLKWFNHIEVKRRNDNSKFDLQVRITPLGEAEVYKKINAFGGPEMVKEFYSINHTKKKDV
jgi:prophage antirepressor-like protein